MSTTWDVPPEMLRQAEQMLQANPLHPQGLRLRGLSRADDPDAAALDLVRAIVASDEEAPAEGTTQLAAWMDWAVLALRHQRPQEASLICRLAIAKGADAPWFAQTLTKMHGRALPAMLLVTMHKSASLFIRARLQQALGLPRSVVSSWTDWRHDVIIAARLRAFAHGWSLAREHIAATPYNLAQLHQRLGRLVVHVRDPRQAMLSAFNFLEKELAQAEDPAQALAGHPALPADYLSRDAEQRLDWYLNYDLPFRCQWLAGWFEAESDPGFGPKILFTRHEDLASDPKVFFSTILSFFGLEDVLPAVDASPPEEGQFHFRQGRTTEWRQALSTRQLDACRQWLPLATAQRFGWEH